MKVIAKLSTRLFNSDAVRDAFVNRLGRCRRHNRRLRKRYAVVLPWLWADSIRVEWDADEPTPAGLTDAEAAAYQIGAAYWAAVGPEVLALIEEEKAYCA